MVELGPNPALRENAPIPGGIQGGVIEGVKRAVMTALQEALMGSVLGSDNSPIDISVDMEYPMKPEAYPGVWVQFSFTKFVNAGIGMEIPFKDPETDKWAMLREFIFEGTVTLTTVALSSLERDRLADFIIVNLMYARIPESVITKADEDTKQFRSLIGSLAHNPYIAMTIDHDTLTAGGQSMTPGVPWDEQLPGYEDNYSFSVLGQSNIVFRHDGTYSLRAISVVEDFIPRPKPFEWQ